MKPFLFLNFKTYSEATGKNALKLARLCESVSKKTGVKVVLVVQAVDLREIANSVELDVFAQHADPVQGGSHTGSILPLALKLSGAKGAVLNHAENKRSNDFVQKAVAGCKKVGLKVLLCAETIGRAAELAVFDPDFLAIEPPELIGGAVSVSTAQPELIEGAVEKICKLNPNIKVIAGAGIRIRNDAKLALKFGTHGIFVASGIVLAKDQKRALQDLALGLKDGLGKNS